MSIRYRGSREPRWASRLWSGCEGARSQVRPWRDLAGGWCWTVRSRGDVDRELILLVWSDGDELVGGLILLDLRSIEDELVAGILIIDLRRDNYELSVHRTDIRLLIQDLKLQIVEIVQARVAIWKLTIDVFP